MFNDKSDKINFSVPTGNFGDVYAGYVAYKMGLPINKLLVATNENDILHRFFKSGEYKIKSVSKTSSPSMDIQIASNFERLLFYIVKNLVPKSVMINKNKTKSLYSFFFSILPIGIISLIDGYDFLFDSKEKYIELQNSVDEVKEQIINTNR